MFRPPAAERTTVSGPAGLLEAVVEVPESAAGASFAVVCHPHPLFGGTLDNKVVHTLARTFHELGTPTVRFNFRGAGRSEGSFDEGFGESEDALAVVAWGRARWPNAALWLGGFSFGGAVAIRVAATSAPALLVTAAPAVRRVDLSAFEPPSCPWLIVQGDADDVVACDDVRLWATEHAAGAELAVLPGVGHFFHGRLNVLKDTVMSFVARQPGAHTKKSPAGR